MNIDAAVERIREAAQGMGHGVRVRYAQTGTAYMTVMADDCDVTVRVADHMEAYQPADGERKICVSQNELSAEQAIEALRNPAAIPAYEVTDEMRREEREAMKADRAMERAEKAGRKRNAAAIRETLTDADFEEFRTRGGNRAAAQDMAKERGLKTGQLYKAITGRNY